MSTFDDILPHVVRVLNARRAEVEPLAWLLINRDLNGRVRLIAPDALSMAERERLTALYRDLAAAIAPHAFSEEAGILYEPSSDLACQGVTAYPLAGFMNVRFVDRLASESRWESIASVAQGVPRVVFFSIKGGVGRSTALGASAWALARQGKRVLVLDLDLESPGLSSALLPHDRQPKYGITDWLVEDLVDNGDALLEDLYGTSDLPVAGQIYLVPAHGLEPGEYVSKLGRVWMPKVDATLRHEVWSSRLNRLLGQLEERLRPDVILIDSRAGIDEVAAACVTELGVHTVMMFATQGRQTWTGYQALFAHWQRCGVITDIRERLQLVAGLVPDDGRQEYFNALRADAYALFEESYDEVGPGEIGGWSFEEDDEHAPHSPLSIRWNRGWYGLLSLQGRLAQIDERDVTLVYGPLLEFLDRALMQEEQ
ncbi:ParA family protein [Aeromonas sanarellii]|uniref:ParA family protein n=1 Tax=Aeromonas caviae TaxID=648 RepID=UPI000FE3B4FA|nr:ParA family protein [Aeromonas caviae]MEA9421994.1 ParA family protein [Aeromonas caviae]RWT28947.1 ParA family protein [Aeromonas caviae]